MENATRKVFLQMFYSNLEVVAVSYVQEDIVYKWIDDLGKIYYIVCPKTFSKYIDFKKSLEPLLQELV
jgi:hypothetical protein